MREGIPIENALLPAYNHHCGASYSPSTDTKPTRSLRGTLDAVKASQGCTRWERCYTRPSSLLLPSS